MGFSCINGAANNLNKFDKYNIEGNKQAQKKT